MKNRQTGSDIALDVQGVCKKFRRGELYTSLRDLVPAFAERLLRKRSGGELDGRDFWALQDVSFRVERGEAFAIVGGNGAGKSTLLKLLTGIMRQDRGSIRVAGRVSALIEVSAGFHQDLTGRENVYLNGAILGLTRDEVRRRFDSIVAFSGLEEFIDTPVKRYSSGMFARLGFSVAAHVDPDVLLVDEVLAVGDEGFTHKCLDKFAEFRRRGKTILLVEQNARQVLQVADHAYVMERGRINLSGSGRELLNNPEVQRTYLGQHAA